MTVVAETRHVFLVADEGFVVPLAVTLRSLAESQPSEIPVQVTVLSVGIEIDSQMLVRRSMPAHVKVTFVPCEPPTIDRGRMAPHITGASLCRLDGPHVLPPDVTRAVYLDADVLVRDDLGPLFSLDLDGNVIAASQEVGIPHVSSPGGLRSWRALGLPPRTPYFNGGVMVIDTALWRERNIRDRSLEFIADPSNRARLLEQDGMNGVIGGAFTRLHLRWNQEAALRAPTHHAFSFFDVAEIDAALSDPAIVHFTGADKPWQRNCRDPYAATWQQVHLRTALAHRKGPRLPWKAAVLRSGRRIAIDRLLPKDWTN